MEELQARWGPFGASAGTYTISGDTVTPHVVVAKAPAVQGKGVLRATIKLDDNNLWLTALERCGGKVENLETLKFVRVE